MRRLLIFVRDVAAPALFACWIVYLGYGAVAGAASYRTLKELKADIAVRRIELDEISIRRAALKKHAELLNARSLDADMIDERARAVLGYAREGDIVLPRSEVERLLAPQSDR